uniref:Uncharacterized protein n=1 Tax=Tanacetum cinerariifolium TaxID=118510 RepID=A0A699GGV2_TANCI|nr:hypothetical protein [Tanacetum cinerariifolium]
MDENEDPKEKEFKEEEEPQEEEDMKVDIEEDENEPNFTYPYEEVDPLNPLTHASESEPKDVIKVEDMVEPDHETVHASVHEVGESSTASFLQEDNDGLFPGLMRRDINSLFGTAATENLVRKLGNAEEKDKCKKLKNELEEARFGNTLLCMQKERVERDLYWTRVKAHEFYREMIRKGFMFKERLDETIDVPLEDEESPSSEPQGSFHGS